MLQFILCSIIFSLIKYGQGINNSDIIIESAAEPIWTSTLFTIPTLIPGTSFWSVCRLQSIYYCLNAFETKVNKRLINIMAESPIGNIFPKVF